MPGRVLLDLRLITEREEKLRTYSFEEACEFHFNHPKELLSTSTLTELFHDPQPSSQQRVLEYSVREAVLAQRYRLNALISDVSCPLRLNHGSRARVYWPRGTAG